MSGTPDILKQFGGQPVGVSRTFEGWWGGDVCFVDFDNGTVEADGLNSMIDPAKHMQTAIDVLTTNGTVYMRPRAFSSGDWGEDPQQITPYSDDAENWHIDAAKTGMSLIGCGKGLSHAGVHQCWIGGYSGLTTAVIRVNAPGCVIEGFRAQPPASAAQGIIYAINDATYNAGNLTIVNCEFHDANTTGGINIDSAWEVALIGNRFVNCDYGILVTSNYSVPQIWEVSDNIFNAAAAEVYCNFQATGGIKRFTARRNTHASEQPLGGGANMYYNFVTTSTGIIVKDEFGAYDAVAENLCTLSGVNMAGCHSTAGLVVEAS